jgi:hypothetical protein
MAIIELSLKETYVPTWGGWESLREAMQNGLDEDLRGHPLTVKYHKGWLTIYNQGADMSTDALLLGETDKADNPDLSGQYGEGLDVGLLAGVRTGYEIKITTKTETWAPYIGPSSKFQGRNVLKVATRKLKVHRDGVTVAIKMPKAAWEKSKNLFLRFARFDRGKHLIEIEGTGAIVTDPKFQGRVYVKGIFAQHIPDLEYGYNLLNMKLDRDRCIVDDWDLKWELKRMLAKALKSRPEAMTPTLYNMLRNDKKDVQGFKFGEDSTVEENIGRAWLKEHGKDAVPVTSIGDSASVSHLGRHGVVVNDTLNEVLTRAKVDTPTKVRASLSKSTVKDYGWLDLSEEEQRNLMDAAEAVDAAARTLEYKLPPLLNSTKVVDFFEEGIVGQHDRGIGIKIAKKRLAVLKETVSTLTHEMAHMVSGSSDGMPGHVGTMERIWAELYWQARQSTAS